MFLRSIVALRAMTASRPVSSFNVNIPSQHRSPSGDDADLSQASPSSSAPLEGEAAAAPSPSLLLSKITLEALDNRLFHFMTVPHPLALTSLHTPPAVAPAAAKKDDEAEAVTIQGASKHGNKRLRPRKSSKKRKRALRSSSSDQSIEITRTTASDIAPIAAAPSQTICEGPSLPSSAEPWTAPLSHQAWEDVLLEDQLSHDRQHAVAPTPPSSDNNARDESSNAPPSLEEPAERHNVSTSPQNNNNNTAPPSEQGDGDNAARRSSSPSFVTEQLSQLPIEALMNPIAMAQGSSLFLVHALQQFQSAAAAAALPTSSSASTHVFPPSSVQQGGGWMDSAAACQDLIAWIENLDTEVARLEELALQQTANEARPSDPAVTPLTTAGANHRPADPQFLPGEASETDDDDKDVAVRFLSYLLKEAPQYFSTPMFHRLERWFLPPQQHTADADDQANIATTIKQCERLQRQQDKQGGSFASFEELRLRGSYCFSVHDTTGVHSGDMTGFTVPPCSGFPWLPRSMGGSRTMASVMMAYQQRYGCLDYSERYFARTLHQINKEKIEQGEAPTIRDEGENEAGGNALASWTDRLVSLSKARNEFLEMQLQLIKDQQQQQQQVVTSDADASTSSSSNVIAGKESEGNTSRHLSWPTMSMEQFSSLLPAANDSSWMNHVLTERHLRASANLLLLRDLLRMAFYTPRTEVEEEQNALRKATNPSSSSDNENAALLLKLSEEHTRQQLPSVGAGGSASVSSWADATRSLEQRSDEKENDAEDRSGIPAVPAGTTPTQGATQEFDGLLQLKHSTTVDRRGTHRLMGQASTTLPLGVANQLVRNVVGYSPRMEFLRQSFILPPTTTTRRAAVEPSSSNDEGTQEASSTLSSLMRQFDALENDEEAAHPQSPNASSPKRLSLASRGGARQRLMHIVGSSLLTPPPLLQQTTSQLEDRFVVKGTMDWWHKQAWDDAHQRLARFESRFQDQRAAEHESLRASLATSASS